MGAGHETRHAPPLSYFIEFGDPEVAERCAGEFTRLGFDCQVEAPEDPAELDEVDASRAEQGLPPVHRGWHLRVDVPVEHERVRDVAARFGGRYAYAVNESDTYVPPWAESV